MAAQLLAFLIVVPITLLPLRLQDLLGDLVGLLAMALLPRRRSVVRANLSVAFPHLTPTLRGELVRAHFRHLGRVAIDMLQQPLYRFRPLIWRKIRPRGWEHLQAAIQSRQGATILCSHFGSWEACAAIATEPGAELLSVYKRSKGFGDAFLLALRQGFPQQLFSKQESRRALLKGARRGALLGLIGDQGGHTKYPFFGRPAYFPDGPGHFWGKLGVPPLFVVSVRRPGGTYECHVKPLDIPARDQVPPGEHRRVVVEAYIRELEAWVRRYPEQYYWVHDVWRTFKDD